MRDSLQAGCGALIRDSPVRWGLAFILSIGSLVTNSPGQGSLRVHELEGSPHQRGWVLESGTIRVTLLGHGGHIAEIRLIGAGSAASINPLFLSLIHISEPTRPY